MTLKKQNKKKKTKTKGNREKKIVTENNVARLMKISTLKVAGVVGLYYHCHCSG